ncbi:MAG TPA: polyphosphate polymerase domain-containing protein [Chloroflexota bacterium]|nr:polyphosphate polymerase domain-containing protein [Chloroflexota bacterium]HUM71000.1 polyphosphate polymerase domain-containing protein [Chloroflexota bacterium]
MHSWAGQMVGAAVTPTHPLIHTFRPISLAEMAEAALLNRTDTKFVLATADLLAALADLSSAYRVLEVGGNRLNHYQTLYFDTPDFALYHRHHAGAAERYKVRARAYVESDLAFFEVKHKTRKKRTVKERLPTPQMVTQVGKDTAVFLDHHYPYDPADLRPVLGNSFTRLTLVSTARPERLTLDFDLAFYWGPQRVMLPGLAVAEVKQDGFSAHSDFIRHIRARHTHPTSFSKYCLGAALLYPHLKQNNFKRQLLLIQKLLSGGYHAHTH